MEILCLKPDSMNYKVLISIGLVFFIIGINCLSFAQTGQFNRIVGCAMTEDSLPRLNTIITLYDEEKIVTGTITDFDSEFILSPLKPGTYSIKAIRYGYKTKTIDNIVVENNKQTDTIRFILEKLKLGEIEDYSNLSQANKTIQMEYDEKINKIDTNNLKQGEWTFYYNEIIKNSVCNCRKTQSIGYFKNDKKEGEWKYFDLNNQLIETVIYKNGNELTKKKNN